MANSFIDIFPAVDEAIGILNQSTTDWYRCRAREQAAASATTACFYATRRLSIRLKASTVEQWARRNFIFNLSLVRHIVEAHHGKVTVESEPGQGSTFTIHLPVAPGSGENSK